MKALQPESKSRYDNVEAISYLNEDTKPVIHNLPGVTTWEKKLDGVLMGITFMSLLIYVPCVWKG